MVGHDLGGRPEAKNSEVVEVNNYPVFLKPTVQISKKYLAHIKILNVILWLFKISILSDK
jgi:hypothetical protein